MPSVQVNVRFLQRMVILVIFAMFAGRSFAGSMRPAVDVRHPLRGHCRHAARNGNSRRMTARAHVPRVVTSNLCFSRHFGPGPRM
jgi:hypothetical protein